MKRIDTINSLDRDYGLMTLFKIGVIQWTELRDRDIYLQYDIYRKKGIASMDAKEHTAEDFNVDQRTVARAIRKMNEEICNTLTGTDR
jgi:hypothetical protein